MRLVTYQANGSTAVGVEAEEGIVETGFEDMVGLIAGGSRALEQAAAAAAQGKVVEGARLLAPLPRPHLLAFHSVNFPSIVEETPDCPVPGQPAWFSKLPSSVIGPDAEIRKPEADTHLDWEAEVGVVIGTRAAGLGPDNALDHVFGYTVVNDVSARDIQLDRGDVMLGKGSDTFCPMGPAIVTADEIPDPGRLSISAYLNDERVQHDSLTSMYFDFPEILAALTAKVTLQPGDIVTGGTPGGLGMNMSPPRWLAPGDVIAVEADVIGRISNPVAAGW